MCACKETDMRESPNNSTPTGGEGQGSRGETFHPIYSESPISSMAEHPLYNIYIITAYFTHNMKCKFPLLLHIYQNNRKIYF
jgi:hypothetical protein